MEALRSPTAHHSRFNRYGPIVDPIGISAGMLREVGVPDIANIASAEHMVNTPLGLIAVLRFPEPQPQNSVNREAQNSLTF